MMMSIYAGPRILVFLTTAIVSFLFSSSGLAINNVSSTPAATAAFHQGGKINSSSSTIHPTDPSQENRLHLFHLQHRNLNEMVVPENTRYAYCEPKKKVKDDIILRVIHTEFNCSEGSCENHYSGCKLEIDYTLSAETLADVSVDTSVSCKAKIFYRTGLGYVLSSESESETAHHLLHAHMEKRSTINLGFHFSSFEDVVETSLHSVECTILKSASFAESISLSSY
jgi:hypothetical protein